MFFSAFFEERTAHHSRYLFFEVALAFWSEFELSKPCFLFEWSTSVYFCYNHTVFTWKLKVLYCSTWFVTLSRHSSHVGVFWVAIGKFHQFSKIYKLIFLMNFVLSGLFGWSYFKSTPTKSSFLYHFLISNFILFYTVTFLGFILRFGSHRAYEILLVASTTLWFVHRIHRISHWCHVKFLL